MNAIGKAGVLGVEIAFDRKMRLASRKQFRARREAARKLAQRDGRSRGLAAFPNDAVDNLQLFARRLQKLG